MRNNNGRSSKEVLKITEVEVTKNRQSSQLQFEHFRLHQRKYNQQTVLIEPSKIQKRIQNDLHKALHTCYQNRMKLINLKTIDL